MYKYINFVQVFGGQTYAQLSNKGIYIYIYKPRKNFNIYHL